MFKRYKTGDCYLLVGVIITVDHIVGTIGDKTTGEIVGRTFQVIKPRASVSVRKSSISLEGNRALVLPLPWPSRLPFESDNMFNSAPAF
jgi:hypothetical protein